MMEYEGRPFVLGESDCFSLVRDYYKQEFNIELPNVARPDEFWDHGLDLYIKHYHREGFELIDEPSYNWQRGDVILMAILSPLANHAAIVMDDGRILHHVFGRLSIIEDYRGIWRNNTVGVYRHKDVVIPKNQTEVNLMDHLPEYVRKRIDVAIAQQT